MINKKILVSVLLPVYNGEKYIREAMDSILRQTHENLELIVINDGSTDSTLSILKEYEKKDFRIRLVSRENKGLIATLNEGAELALGQWIARMDADDIAMPNRLERQLNWLEQTGSDIAGAWVSFFGAKDFRVWKGCQSDEAIKVDMLFKCPLVHPSIIIRTSLLKQLKYDPVAEKAEDYDLWVRAAMHGLKMTNVPEVLLKYRQHDAQVTLVASKEQKCMTEKIRERYYEYFVSHNHLSEHKLSAKAIFGFETITTEPLDFKSIDSFFTKLASQINMESRKVLMDNLYRLSLRNRSAGKVWIGLNKRFGQNNPFIKKLSIYISQLLPTRLRNAIFQLVKKCFYSPR